MKLFVKGMLCASLMITATIGKDVVIATEKETATTQSNTADIQIFTSDNTDGKITPASIEEAFKKVGLFVSANRDMNGPFKKQFKETTFDVYNLFTYFSKKETVALVKKYPNIGLFAPLSMSIYTKKGKKKISASSLTIEAVAKILKIPVDDKDLVKVFTMSKEALKAAMPNGKYETNSYSVQKLVGEAVSKYTMEMDEEEWDDEFGEFQIEFEGQLAPNGFVKAGFNDMTFLFDEVNYEGFDIYSVYSICKLPVIYTVAKVYPEAGAYAPCSLYMSKKKDDQNMNIAFPSVYNWISSMDIKDEKLLNILNEAQKSMNKILTDLTAE